MDVSRYEFACQKALHVGLQYAKGFSHQVMECEHVAMAILRSGEAPISQTKSDHLRRHLEKILGSAPRIFGAVKIEFGSRLDAALDWAESSALNKQVTLAILWDAISRQSTAIQNVLATESGEESGVDRGDSKSKPKKPRSSTEPEPKKKEESQSKGEVSDKLLKYTIDLTGKAERGELDPIVGRDAEVRRVLEILGRKKKNNPILIGEPGVGKSAIAEAIALRISEGNVPESMRTKRLLSLDLGAILAGAKYRGEFEDRLKGLLKGIEEHNGQIILFIDEIHMIVGAGNPEGSADAANLLKPALARGDIHCLGATTLDEYRTHIEKDPALERRFQPLLVDEPTRDAALSILRGLKSRYEIYHGVRIDDEALVAAVDMSIRYLTSRKLPDKCIDLIDEAASRLRLQIDSMPAVLDQMRSQIAQIEIEKKAIAGDASAKSAMSVLSAKLSAAKTEYNQIEEVWAGHKLLLEQLRQAESKKQDLQALFESAKAKADFDLAARLQYSELPQSETYLTQIQNKLDAAQQKHPFLRQVVGAREIAEVVAIWSRIPVQKLLQDDARKLLAMEARLGARVFGQETALRAISKAVKRASVGVNDPRRPLGVFLFLGPTGVGKTETAKALAEELFDDESKMVRVDMSEYMEQHNVARLIGAPPGYVGYGEGGELTEAVRRNPYSVVLFDEIEKGHPRVLDILLQVFEDGRLTDGNGQTVDFRNALIVMTSNIALDLISKADGSYADGAVRKALSGSLRPEFVNRIDEVVVFRKLASKHLERVIDRMVDDLNGRLGERQFRVVIGESVKTRLLASGQDGAFGGRAIRRAFQFLVVDHVSDRILVAPQLATGTWIIDFDSHGTVKWTEEYIEGKYLPPARDA